MPDFTDRGPIPEPPELRERFEALSRGVGMLLMVLSGQPMHPQEMRAAAKDLGYEPGEMPLVVPAVMKR